MQRGDGTTVVQWSSYRKDAVDRWEDIKAAVQANVAEYVRGYAKQCPVEEPSATDDDRLVVATDDRAKPEAGIAADAPPPSPEEALKIAAEVTAKGDAARGEQVCTARATNSLPVPLSP